MENDNNQEIINCSNDKKKFNFNEYYKSNPEFRQRCKDKAGEKLLCDCGRLVTRANMKTHKSSTVHKKQMDYLDNK